MEEIMFSEFYTEKGVVRISEMVLAKVVSNILMSSYGVVGLTHRNAADGINTLLHKDKMFKGVILKKSKNGLIIDLDVVLKYGVSIPTIARNLAETIKYRTETITGIDVDKVNIYVQGIRI